ncbi:hypothetical protein LPB72_05250 [Hydrogenophaga crassostreae]|uniref:DUF2946 domain-containing protein n=1 Tax=Hydrogenophaga crassostreae TaxID=1763535 RepID=A0A167INL2_9BURK|nr:DUF2946 family protein [Hydrogenophaga crassostreae]AOW14652.1 hypothetical protein LPB072_19300 [Hydrogenophaga crassostreae]OAD43251.1 hypothetical protein LPB72_05250 [Hydrogenophaga crassostreae]
MGLISPHLLRRLAGWLVGAMLLATLAPAVSRTLAASHQAGDWVEICTTQGMRWAQVGVDDVVQSGGLDEGLSHAMDRCGHCTLASDRFAPLLPALPAVASDPGTSPLPRHIRLAIRATFAPSPSARGPPLLN